MKRITFILFSLIIIFGCEKANDLISPYHYTLMSRPVLSALDSTSVDTTGGKYRILLKWTVSDTNNIRNYEVHRSVKLADNFRAINPSSVGSLFYQFADSTVPTFSDTIALFYKIFPYGYKTDPKTKLQSTVQGPESETVLIVLRKKKI